MQSKFSHNACGSVCLRTLERALTHLRERRGGGRPCSWGCLRVHFNPGATVQVLQARCGDGIEQRRRTTPAEPRSTDALAQGCSDHAAWHQRREYNLKSQCCYWHSVLPVPRTVVAVHDVCHSDVRTFRQSDPHIQAHTHILLVAPSMRCTPGHLCRCDSERVRLAVPSPAVGGQARGCGV